MGKRNIVAGLMTATLMLSLVAAPANVALVHADSISDAYANGTDTGASKQAATVGKVTTVTKDTIRGVDLTSYQAESKAGVQYFDFDGKRVDGAGLMKLLSDSGVNYINLKVAVDPSDDKGHTYGAGNPTLTNAIATAKLAKAAGLKVNIDFLYSDAMTSNNNQKLPKGWPTDADGLTAKVKNYTADSLAQLASAGVTPDMVTVGNEMGQNFLSQTDWATITQLLSAATATIREKAPKANIALSFAKPSGSWWSTIAWNLQQGKVDYDTMAAVIYPAWDKLSDVKDAKDEIVNNYHKKFSIASVTYPFTDQDSDGQNNGTTASDILSSGVGTVSPQGQATYLQQLFSTVATADNNSGAGVFYGDAVWIATKPGNSNPAWQINRDNADKFGTGWATQYADGYVDGAAQYWGAGSQDNQALFDDMGKPLQSLTTFKQIADESNTSDTPTEDTTSNVKSDPFQTGEDTGLKQQQVTINKVPNMTSDTIRGVDVSSYEALKEAGVKYYDYDGNEAPLMKILAESGVNYIRLRIWNNPYNDKGQTYGGGASDVAHELKIAKEAKQYGMKVLLDFHYSDFWADPAQQILPKAWKNHSQAQLEQDVYNYTSDTVKKFTDAGVNVGMVQIGNEITNGMMGITTNRDKGESYSGVWDDANKSKNLTALLNAGSKAVRKTAPNALITVHIETPEMNKYDDIMSVLKANNVDYDVLGSSYYPYWSVSAKANTPETLTAVQKMAGEKYGKLFAVMETAWVNSLQDADGTPNSIGDEQSDWQNTKAYGVGPQGQVDELSDLYKTMMSQPNGLGAFYWEPAWVPVKAGWNNWQANKDAAEKYGTGWASSGALGYFPDEKMYYNGKPAWGGTSWDNNTLFDDRGYALQSLKFYKDAASEQKVQTTRVNFVHGESGEVLATHYGSTVLDQTVTVPSGDVEGYLSGQYTGKADTEGLKTVTVKLTEAQPTGNAKTGYLQANDGKWYWFENGKKFTGFRYYMGAYYWFNKGVRQNNKWETAWGMKYYVGADGRAVQGVHAIDGKAYDFGTNGTFNLKGNASGYLQDTDGHWYWFDNGSKYTGFRYYMGAYYWFEKGVRQNNKWETAWGMKYYVGADGRATQGVHAIDGKAYDFGTNGTFNLKGNASGYLQDTDGHWYWFDNGSKFTGFRYYMGAYYWFEKGVRQNNKWETAWGMKYYVGADGRAVQGRQVIDGKTYNFGDNGTFYLR
ncbi:glycosyl hydrolase 53 family protein [Weissella confusa]|uniref:glycosyl hydrolase 53 family protein n=1 Tax=Weissella confusa TaxID=1583 RepID=UPI0035A2E18C